MDMDNIIYYVDHIRGFIITTYRVIIMFRLPYFAILNSLSGAAEHISSWGGQGPKGQRGVGWREVYWGALGPQAPGNFFNFTFRLVYSE